MQHRIESSDMPPPACAAEPGEDLNGSSPCGEFECDRHETFPLPR